MFKKHQLTEQMHTLTIHGKNFTKVLIPKFAHDYTYKKRQKTIKHAQALTHNKHHTHTNTTHKQASKNTTDSTT